MVAANLLLHKSFPLEHKNLYFPHAMNLESLTNNIVQLCEECNVWSSTINIPLGNGDFLDISIPNSVPKQIVVPTIPMILPSMMKIPGPHLSLC